MALDAGAMTAMARKDIGRRDEAVASAALWGLSAECVGALAAVETSYGCKRIVRHEEIASVPAKAIKTNARGRYR